MRYGCCRSDRASLVVSIRRTLPSRISFPSFCPTASASLYSASEAGKFPRVWLQDLNGGDPKAVSPEGVLAREVSPDDKWVTRVREGFRQRRGTRRPCCPWTGGNTVEINGLKPGEFPLGWTTDGQLYVASADATGAGVKVEKLNPHTGARTPWRVLATAPIGGVIPDPPIITPDGNDLRLRLPRAAVGPLHRNRSTVTLFSVRLPLFAQHAGPGKP